MQWQQTGSGQPPTKRTCARIGASASGRLAQPVNPSMHQVFQQLLPAVDHAHAAGQLKAASTTASAQIGIAVAAQYAQAAAQHSGQKEQKLQQTIAAKVNHAAAQQQAVNRTASYAAKTAAAAPFAQPRQVMSVGQAQTADHRRAADHRKAAEQGNGSSAGADASRAAHAADALLKPADQTLRQHRSAATPAASNAVGATVAAGRKPSARAKHATADNKQPKVSVAKQHNSLIAAADAAAAAAVKVTATLVKTAKAAIKGAASVKQAAVAYTGGEAAPTAAVFAPINKVPASTGQKAAAQGRRPPLTKPTNGQQHMKPPQEAGTSTKRPAVPNRRSVGIRPVDSLLQLGAIDHEAEEQAVAALLALGDASSDSLLHQSDPDMTQHASAQGQDLSLSVSPVVAAIAMHATATQHSAALFRTQMLLPSGTSAAVQVETVEHSDCDRSTVPQQPHSSQTLQVLDSSAEPPHTTAVQGVEMLSKRRKRSASDLDLADVILEKRQRVTRTAPVFHFDVGAGISLVDMDVDVQRGHLQSTSSDFQIDFNFDKPQPTLAD